MSEGYFGQPDVMLAGLAPGSRVAGYLLEERIGAGGMAVVFRARDSGLGRRVALKILAPALAADSGFRERFIRESRAAAAVDDPHIVPVYAAGEADGVLYIAMRLVAGGDLRSVISREGPLSAARAVALLSPVASALDAAHAAGLVHRDVKPANILVDVNPGRPDPYSPDGTMLAVGADSGAVYVWNIRQHALITTLPLHGEPSVQSLAFSPDGRTLAVVEGDSTYLWDLASHTVAAALAATAPTAAFSPDGKTLAIGNQLWDVTTHAPVAALSSAACKDLDGNQPFSVAFSPDGSELAVATGVRTCVWNVATHGLTATVNDPGGVGATAVSFSHQGNLLATGDDDGSIYLWHIS